MPQFQRHPALIGKMTDVQLLELWVLFKDWSAAHTKQWFEDRGDLDTALRIFTLGAGAVVANARSAKNTKERVDPLKKRLDEYIWELEVACPLVKVKLESIDQWRRRHRIPQPRDHKLIMTLQVWSPQIMIHF